MTAPIKINLRNASFTEAPAFKLLCPEWRGPALVINASRLSVTYANENANSCLTRHPFLRISNGHLDFTALRLRKLFLAKLEEARIASDRSAAVMFQSQENGTWHSVNIRFLELDEINALSETDWAAHEPDELAILVLSQCEYRPDPVCIEAFSDALGLSRSERRDLVSIVCGQSAEQIAVETNVAVSTVRYRIKSLLSKSQCSRQRELASLVRSLCPAHYAQNLRPRATPVANRPVTYFESRQIQQAAAMA